MMGLQGFGMLQGQELDFDHFNTTALQNQGKFRCCLFQKQTILK